MKVSIGADHAGFALKAVLIDFFSARGYFPVDRGAYCSAVSDYPDFAKSVSLDVLGGRADFGILICGSGIGMSITANRYKKIRAALCYDVQAAKMAREHNDANVLCLAGRALNVSECLEIVEAFVNSKFSCEERHKKRIEKIDEEGE
ncbi:ribose 5-phosphate isomerase B [Neorickettsia sp. 179522]|uniref:ribose 5-phosphate isomerase B n=1 Tax=Neorickettsia sp. 179522 TaxID=1714371 RepID=UPI00079928E9|nr:ribose 5-phosphate isomerase B [Neorickettsia sp. 179522]KYH12348.1 ribose-5-phosphate isomerase [Neorickettsia sp. 179522]